MKKDDAVQAFGTQAALARALGIQPPSVSEWKDEIPELRAYQLREKYPARFARRGDAEPPRPGQQQE